MSTYTYTCVNATPHLTQQSVPASAHNDAAALQTIKCAKCGLAAYQTAGADAIVNQTVPGGASKPNGQKNLL